MMQCASESSEFSSERCSGTTHEHIGQLLFSKHGLMTVELTEIAEF
jgi:hypothetical protein